jgi:hypothetical protein
MGAANVGMWRIAGLDINKDASCCWVQNPHENGKRLYFMADVPHLLKSMRSGLENNTIILPQNTANRHELPTKEVKMDYILQVATYQEDKELKIVPGLTKMCVNPGQYEKMRVPNTKTIFDRKTSAGIRVLINAGEIDSLAESTAFYCESTADWFEIMTNREYKGSLFTHSVDKLLTLTEYRTLLLKIRTSSTPNGLKPWQKGSVCQQVQQSNSIKILY